MTPKHPYARFENDPVWRALEKGVKSLVKNGDIDEKTARSHIVGYLTKVLYESNVIPANGTAHPRRIIKIGRNEELLVRGVVA